jgi:hypothetical protein
MPISVLCMLPILQPIYLQDNGSYKYKLPLTSCTAGAPIIPCSGQLLPHIRNCRKLLITAPKTTATTLACSPTSQLPTASTHAASVTASHALDRPLSKLSSAPAADFVDAAEFLDAAEFTSAVEFPTVSLCHPSTVLSGLGQSSPKPQLSSACCCASCCVLPHTHSADFRYCHASCHPVATVQQCFSPAYTLTDFNPVTGIFLVILPLQLRSLRVSWEDVRKQTK